MTTKNEQLKLPEPDAKQAAKFAKSGWAFWVEYMTEGRTRLHVLKAPPDAKKK